MQVVTLDILEEYLLEFKGSLVIVSHDRHFLDRLVDHLFVFCGDGVVKDFYGNYTEYRTFLKEEIPDQVRNDGTGKETRNDGTGKETRNDGAVIPGAQHSVIPRRSAPSVSPPARPRRLTYKEKQEFAALEARIPELEAEKAALEAALSSGTLSPAELQEASTR